MLISELPNTPDYPLRALAELRAKEHGNPPDRVRNSFDWLETKERFNFWSAVNNGQRPSIPAESIEDLRRAGMLPEPERESAIKGFERVEPVFYCKNYDVTFTMPACEKQCAECQATEGHNAPPVAMEDYPPSITLSDYAEMEREHEAITSPDHYKVCEGLEVVDMIRAVLTPEQFKGYCIGNMIKYRMRAGKKTMSPLEDLGKAHVYQTWLKEMEGGEVSRFNKLYNHLAEEHNLLLVESEKQEILNLILNP